MLPRPAVFAIVVFWLAATSWQIHRDMWPNWFPPPDDPPPFDVGVLDELSSDHTDWQVFVDGVDAGSGSSEVKNLGDGSLEFNSVLLFRKKPLFDLCSYIGSSNRITNITNKGQLLSMSIKAKVKLPANLNGLGAIFRFLMPSNNQDAHGLKPETFYDIGVDSHVEEGRLKSKLTFLGTSMELKSIAVPENGIVFNPAHTGTRIRQLRKGQTWRVPLLDVGAAANFADGVVGKELRAAVDEEVINWGGKDVDCFRIDFTQQGKGVVASTWVRQRDGQVLKQQAKMEGLVELLLIRVPSN